MEGPHKTMCVCVCVSYPIYYKDLFNLQSLLKLFSSNGHRIKDTGTTVRERMREGKKKKEKRTYIEIHSIIYLHTLPFKSLGFVIKKCYAFEKSLFCSPGLHLFDTVKQ